MRVIASPRAVEFIREHGGRLFVWTDRMNCCESPRFVQASIEEPDDVRMFRGFASEDFEVHIRPVDGEVPQELRVDVTGRRRARVSAYWNGCVYVL